MDTGEMPRSERAMYKSRAEEPHPSVDTMMKRIRLLVVDDEARVRQGLAMRLEDEPDIEIVGESADGCTALQLALDLRPDVVVLDLLMPGMGGLHTIRLLRAAVPESIIVAVSIRDDTTIRREAAAAGAAAFLAKQEGPERLLATIRDIGGRRPRLGVEAE
jgi:DNA-binding NarL/FixJ family response regulator